MPRAAPAPGHNVKISVSLYASCVKAGEMHRLTVGQYVEKAIEAQLERDRHAFKLNRYEAAKHEAIRRRDPSPLPQDFGLPHSLG